MIHHVLGALILPGWDLHFVTRQLDSSTLSGSTDREDFTPTPENYDALVQRTLTLRRENALFLEYAKRKNKEPFPQGVVSESAARIRHTLKRRGKLPQFPTNRKLEMANHVISQIEGDIKQEERRGTSEIAEIRARLIQIGVREKEIDKEMAIFHRDVLEGERDQRSGQINGDDLLKWYEHVIKDKDAKIGKLRLKRDSMKSQIARTRARLQQKKELGEKLQQVDYDQLQINNEGFQQEIAELSKKLADLQKISSFVVSKLNAARTKLASEERVVRVIDQGIKQKRSAIGKYEKEADAVDDDHRKLLVNNEDIATKKSEFRVPEVADYIDKKAKVYELSKVIRNWERKVQLAEMNVRRLKKDLAKVSTPRRTA
jgi:chromosome segregation ATPase